MRSYPRGSDIDMLLPVESGESRETEGDLQLKTAVLLAPNDSRCTLPE